MGNTQEVCGVSECVLENGSYYAWNEEILKLIEVDATDTDRESINFITVIFETDILKLNQTTLDLSRN